MDNLLQSHLRRQLQLYIGLGLVMRLCMLQSWSLGSSSVNNTVVNRHGEKSASWSKTHDHLWLLQYTTLGIWAVVVVGGYLFDKCDKTGGSSQSLETDTGARNTIAQS